ncbi:Putative efflux system component YknX [Phycisphaerales bacterium]|nr:Putative efflux system component YknX [Phycisphaerales bacterium]
MTKFKANIGGRARRGGALWWTLGVLAGGGTLAGGTLALQTRQPARTSGMTADRAVASKASFDVTTTASGELEARERIEIRSPLDQESTIVQIMDEGVWANKGDVLIQLNADPIQQKIDDESLRFRTESAEFGTAQTDYNIQEKDNEAKVRQAQLKVTLAELALNQWREGDVQKKRQDLSLGLDKATLELSRLAERYTRSQDLLAEGFVSKDECDRDEVSYIEAISAYNTAVLARDVYEHYELVKDEKSKMSDLDEAQHELERVKLNNANQLANKLTRLESQRERVSIVEKRLAKLKQDLAAATIIAPSEGLVVYASSMERNMWGRGGDGGPLQIGQQVWSNQLLMILPNTTEMVAAVRVSESLAGRVQAGQRASVKVDAAGGRVFDGEVESIGVMAETGGWRDPNLREYTVRIRLNIDEASLKPAMRCEARLVLDHVDDAIAVPVQGVFSEGPVNYVYTPQGSKFVRTPVKLGRRSDTRAELKEGLEAGKQILIREPAPGEIIAQAWDTDVLKTLGYKIGLDGQPMAEATQPPPMLGPDGQPITQPKRDAAQQGDNKNAAPRDGGQRPPGGNGKGKNGGGNRTGGSPRPRG